MAIRVAADKPGALNCTVTLDGLTPHTVNKGQSNEMVLAGSAERDNKGMRFQCRLKAINAGGRVAVEDEVVTVEDANSVVFLLTGATSFNGPLKDPETEGVDEKQRALDMMRACENKSWNELLTAHIKDHQRLFRTFYLELGGRHKPKPGATQKGIDDQQPHALVMQFGRYLLIAGSRADSPTPMS
jgi:alpha-L-fucosidase 2